MLSCSVGIVSLGPMPEIPSRIARHCAPASWPSALMLPIPVIATRRIPFPVGLRSGRRRGLCFREQFLDGVDETFHGFRVEVRIAVGQRYLVVIFELENGLHGVELLDLEFFQCRFGRDLCDIDAGFLGNDAEDGVLNTTHEVLRESSKDIGWLRLPRARPRSRWRHAV